jgi:iron complex transport system substrate-binding protein
MKIIIIYYQLLQGDGTTRVEEHRMFGMRKPFVIFIAFMLLAMLFAGCANTGQVASQQNTAAHQDEKTAAFPKTIKHAKGETVIPSKPKTVAVTYFPYAEHLFAIGETAAVKGVAGLKSLRNFPVYEVYTKEGNIADLGDEPNLEKILELNPDVIIAWEADENRFEQLSKIAPTIMIPSSENWQDTIMQVAAVMGEEDKAQQYIDRYNKKLKDVASLMEQSGEKGKTALFLMTWGKGFNYYGGVRMSPYYKGLGFKAFAKMKDYGEISLEGVSELNPDYIFLGEDFTHSADVTLQELGQNPVWKNLRAVKNNKLFVVDTEIMGPLAMGQYKGLEVIESIMKDGK